MNYDQSYSQIVGAGLDMAAALKLWAPQPADVVETPPPASMARTLREATEAYLKATEAKPRTADEYRTTLAKWDRWNLMVHRSRTPMQHEPERAERAADLDRHTLADFLDWVYDEARTSTRNANPGRTHNKARGHLRAVLTHLATRGDLAAVPVLPPEREQRDEAGLFFLSAAELEALYWATYRMERPWRWAEPRPVGAYWRAALACFLAFGCDTQTLFPYSPGAAPLKWRDVYHGAQCPDRSLKDDHAHGWLHYRRTKTGRVFVVPMPRIVRAHLDAIRPDDAAADADVFASSGGGRPNERFQELVKLAGIGPKRDFTSNRELAWTLKDLRKTSATEHEDQLPGSAVAILGHASSEITYKHYANRAKLAFRALTQFKFPAAFGSIFDDSIKPPGMLFAT